MVKSWEGFVTSACLAAMAASFLVLAHAWLLSHTLTFPFAPGSLCHHLSFPGPCSSFRLHLNVAPVQHTFLDSHGLPCPASLFPLLLGSVLRSAHLTCPDGGEALQTGNMLRSIPWAHNSNGTQHAVGAQ